MVSQRYSKANNSYLKHYDPSEPTSYILYLDANNLYGWAMSQPLPTGEFQWLSDDEINSLNVTRSIVMRNVPQRMFLRRFLKCLHREKSHKIWFWGFGIFAQSKYQSLSQFFYIFEER